MKEKEEEGGWVGRWVGGCRRGAKGEEMRKQMPALGIDAISSVSQLMTNSTEGETGGTESEERECERKIKKVGRGKKKTRARNDGRETDAHMTN